MGVREGSHLRHSTHRTATSTVVWVMLLSSRRMLGSLLFAGIWVVIAANRPTTTFHLAPLIVAAWPAFGERDLNKALPMALLGGLIATATTSLLVIAGWLNGPSLLPWGGAALESVVATAAGAVIGLSNSVVARLNSRNG